MTAPAAFFTLVSGVPTTGPLMAGGSSLVQSQDTGIQLSPRIVPPVASIAINVADSAATVGIGVVNLPGCSVRLGPNNEGVINTIELMIDGPTIATRVYWRVSINGSPAAGWGALTILGRNGAASIARAFPPPMGLTIPAGGRLDVDVINSDGGSYTVGATLYGWQWSPQAPT